MSTKLARRTKTLIRRTRGMLGNLPRCTNLSRTPALGIIGYVEVNKNATTPFSRSKVHKGIFACSSTEAKNGDLILDRGEDSYYFIMDRKVEIFNGEEVYIDATMYRCDKTVDIYRFEDSARDAFGRPTVAAPTLLHSKVRSMTNPQNYDVVDQPDRLIANNKIQICVQESLHVHVADRIVTSSGAKYHVVSVDDESLTGLVLCAVDTDVR